MPGELELDDDDFLPDNFPAPGPLFGSVLLPHRAPLPLEDLPGYPEPVLPDGAAVMQQAEAWVKQLATGDLTNPRVVAVLEKALKLLRVMARVFAPKKSEREHLEGLRDARWQDPNPVETFNSRLIREFMPVVAQYLAVQQQQADTAKADMKLRAAELSFDMKKTGLDQLASETEAVVAESPVSEPEPAPALVKHCCKCKKGFPSSYIGGHSISKEEWVCSVTCLTSGK